MLTLTWITTVVVAFALGAVLAERRAKVDYLSRYEEQIDKFAQSGRRARDQFEQELAAIRQAWFRTTVHAYNAGAKEGKENNEPSN